ncbi:MAG: biotin--[acetyl-CoA-carboxylase] ligase [Candidatus Omnitrophica bacterium]|nr:biotin--[acetyl-CoA-carboxylase] ligase [Candidatus Omnitrophota bacterium]MBU1870329.1 biotin--[acetyl-CoA-carboxylase] ligase [Candidatus Omnitrophota bacterium]
MLQEKIVDFLKKNEDYVSGEEISERLKISRQALWKHIQELKESGYDIIAVPHLGYKLNSLPDRLFEYEVSRGLNTQIIGKKIYYFESIASTMEQAMELGLKGAPEGAIVLAELQTRGKGRLGRSWFSPKHKGIYLSLILRPKILPSQASVLTLLAAVSVCEAIKNATGLEIQIKWPNDILINNKKLGGILTELSAEMDRVSFLVIGIGLNVNNEKKSLISGATSIKEIRKENSSRVVLLQELLRKIEDNYLLFQKKGAHPIIEKWREHGITIGKRVKVYCQKEHIEGEAVDIDNDGGLLVRKDSGVTEKVMAGDVMHCR